MRYCCVWWLGVSPAEPPIRNLLEYWERKDKSSPSGTTELAKNPDCGGPRTAYPMNILPFTMADPETVPQMGNLM